ncbi:MAG: FliH/SctL family protein [Gemmatimonadota bacterium]
MTFSFEPITYPTIEELDQRVAAAAVDTEPSVLDLPDLGVEPELLRPPTPEADVEARARALEEVRAAAHQRGFEEGRRAEGERVRTLVEAVNSIVSDLRAEDQRREEDGAERIAALATAVAGHLIEREIRTSPEVLAGLVRRAIAEFPVNERLVVHLNPSDLALLTSGLVDEGTGQLSGGHPVEWVADPAVRSGGCLVAGSERIVDARLSRILERVYDAIANE